MLIFLLTVVITDPYSNLDYDYPNAYDYSEEYEITVIESEYNDEPDNTSVPQNTIIDYYYLLNSKF